MHLIENFVRNADQIVQLASTKHCKLFEPRIKAASHGSFLPFHSKFSTLHVTAQACQDLLDLIFSDSQFDPDLKDLHQFIQIQRYLPGEFIVIHRDVYSTTKLHLVTLTTSDVDALVCQDGDNLIRIPDMVGQKIEFDYDAWHYVSPVLKTRYSLVIGE